jgi:hypothetical protein
MTEDFAEYAASALDSFQNLFEQNAHRDHRTDDLFAGELIGDLLTDLMHYADRRGLDFGRIAKAAHDDFLREQPEAPALTIGSAVRLTGTAAQEAALADQPLRGSITGLVITDQGATDFYVRRLGDPRSRRFGEDDLAPAEPFPSVPTRDGIVDHPLKAEKLLIDTALQTALSGTEQPFDLHDHQALLTALATWNGLDEQSTRDLLLAEVEQEIDRAPEPDAEVRNPGALAAQGFPSAMGVPHRAPAPSRAATHASHRSPSR